ncbi:HEAT repeat domain-containing protein [Allobranchiibius sp. CTAmp26]|uniref:HEAT repeat domain-containing protein n=1 Tax=Allobranchiibius sp. CTAmp26 TaxID=2815214 RepID=UPI001AA17228|nr:HEAT repeat domain-containing protein [Allobranchiibius sp. CTAmp26]MBO1756905.1 HEAT repeat domain-containing protein [Allobranchiibius sp. CTAmp26]
MSSPADLISLANELGDALNGESVEKVPGALPRLAEMLEHEADAEVIAAIVDALGYAWDSKAARIVLDHVAVDHPDADVRLAVAQSLPGGVDADEPVRDAVIEALTALTRDDETAIRDWACFGLGQVRATTPAAIEALAARLDDADDDTRCEALLALAQTGDDRATISLRRRLTLTDEMVCLLEIRAAAELADPQLYPLLEGLGNEWAGDNDEFTTALAHATSRCRPEARAQAATVERALLARVGTLLTGQPITAVLVGHYPRTALSFQPIDNASPPPAHDAIWPDQDPWNYPLEQEAQSLVMTYARGGTIN